MKTTMYFTLQVDCEALQHSIRDPRLGERAVRGLARIADETKIKISFMVIPADMKAHARIYRELQSIGHEVGLHVHPADQGYQEFLGVYNFDEQARIIREAMDVFAQHMGRAPESFCPGYGSANDHTFPVLESLGLRHGLVSVPTRNLPQCACVWGNSPMDAHYPHRNNRCLVGNVDFVDMPATIDPESRLWGGAHPQDLRVELVDAKNHWYTIHKSVQRQLNAGAKVPVKYLKADTHNIFDYADKRNFRRETLLGIIAAARSICKTQGCRWAPATSAEVAAEYRRQVPLPKSSPPLLLDTRGRVALTPKRVRK